MVKIVFDVMLDTMFIMDDNEGKIEGQIAERLIWMISD